MTNIVVRRVTTDFNGNIKTKGEVVCDPADLALALGEDGKHAIGVEYIDFGLGIQIAFYHLLQEVVYIVRK